MNVSLHKLGSLVSLLSLVFNLLPPLAAPVYAGEEQFSPQPVIEPEIVIPYKQLPRLSAADVPVPGLSRLVELAQNTPAYKPETRPVSTINVVNPTNTGL